MFNNWIHQENARKNFELSRCIMDLPSNVRINIEKHHIEMYIRGYRGLKLGPYHIEFHQDKPLVLLILLRLIQIAINESLHNYLLQGRPTIQTAQNYLFEFAKDKCFVPYFPDRCFHYEECNLSRSYYTSIELVQFALTNLPKVVINIVNRYTEKNFITVVIKQLDSTKIRKNVCLDWTIQDLKKKISDEPESCRLIYQGQPMIDEYTIEHHELKENEVIHVIQQVRGDIGIFTTNTTNTESTNQILSRLKRKQKSSKYYLETNFFNQSLCTKLCQFVNNFKNVSQKDFQIEISVNELIDMIGLQNFGLICCKFQQPLFNCIRFRKVTFQGAAIPFHTDFAKKTMQIMLNEDYKGGDLMYLKDDGRIEIPKRPMGSFTLHDNQIVHGVSKFISGQRISLFLLYK